MHKVNCSAIQDRRDAAPRQRAAHYAQLDALARADLLAISRHWSGQHTLPDDASGERILHGLLLKGLPATQVADVASWAHRRGVDHYVDKAKSERRTPDADMLGNLIEFYFDDLKAMKRVGHSVRYVAPCDAQRSDVDRFWKAERLAADRQRKKRNRKKEQPMPTPLTKRAKLVHKELSDGPWISVSNIMKIIALRDNQRKRRLAPHALRVAVGRALDELVANGLAETRTEIDERGVAHRVARRAHICGHDSVHVHSVHVHKKASADVESR
jgi:hypothetical protein